MLLFLSSVALWVVCWLPPAACAAATAPAAPGDVLSLPDDSIEPPIVPVALEPLPGHLGGLYMLQLAQPILGRAPTANGMAQLDASFELPFFELYAMPRLRVEDLGHPVQSTSLYFQQVYATLRAEDVRLKVGKLLGQFGRVWDYGLYGPLLAGTDVKMTTDIGVSLETSHDLRGPWALFWAAQFFLLDGKALSFRNPSFFSLDYARRRNVSSARVQPSRKIGRGKLSVAANGQHFYSVRQQMGHVWRAAADVDYSQPGFDAFVEVGQQWGQDVPSDDSQLIGQHTYLWAGVQKAFGKVLLRHHLNLVYYRHQQAWLDVLHQPGAEWLVTDKLSLIAEAAIWHNAPNQAGRGEYSFFLVVMGRT